MRCSHLVEGTELNRKRIQQRKPNSIQNQYIILDLIPLSAVLRQFWLFFVDFLHS